MKRSLFLFLCNLSLQAKICTFLPPSTWEIAQLKNPSPHVEIGFLGKASSDFRPSLNLATEEVDVSLKEYVQAVKEIQIQDPEIKWRDLGSFPLASGKAGQLIEMENSSAWGPLKILQLLFVEEKKAYILTSACLKKQFPALQEDILSSFSSFNLFEDLWTPLAFSEQKTLKALLHPPEINKENWEKLQQFVQDHSELGTYWQFLTLREGQKKLCNQETLQ